MCEMQRRSVGRRRRNCVADEGLNACLGGVSTHESATSHLGHRHRSLRLPSEGEACL